ncbi:hypothetical protein BR93DRAFT_970011 [Coniochaeta sp. PMI_546]|nr:hypothetical protein BR93DRAFT_970011 [Coniochaeta sp. PMI_546]
MAFARVVRWTQTDPRSREDPANPTGDHAVSELLDQIIAAHHLGLDDLKEFEAHISCLLATILLQDRRKLSSAHIDIVDSHECFEKNSPVMRVLFKAGVRPFLQLTMLSPAPMWVSHATPGHTDAKVWLEVIRHCRQLRADHKRYALNVAQQTARTLETCSRSLHGDVLFHDPLDGDEMKGRRRLDFDLTFSI